MIVLIGRQDIRFYVRYLHGIQSLCYEQHICKEHFHTCSDAPEVHDQTCHPLSSNINFIKSISANSLVRFTPGGANGVRVRHAWIWTAVGGSEWEGHGPILSLLLSTCGLSNIWLTSDVFRRFRVSTVCRTIKARHIESQSVISATDLAGKCGRNTFLVIIQAPTT
jgi:hypothetical protein